MTSAGQWRAQGYLAQRAPGRAPWAAHAAGLPSSIGLDIVRAAFAEQPQAQTVTPAPDMRQAAVLVTLFEEESQARVVFIRRSEQVGTHRGDVAFPGGVLEEAETPVAAALREAYEEVGIRSDEVDVIGRLPEFAATGSGFHITPIVAVAGSRPRYVANHEEIDAVFDSSLVEILDPARYREETWRSPIGPPSDIPFFELDGGTVWGATACILLELLAVIVGGGWL